MVAPAPDRPQNDVWLLEAPSGAGRSHRTAVRDPGNRVGPSRRSGNPLRAFDHARGYRRAIIHGLARFTFLPGYDDGEQLFSHDRRDGHPIHRRQGDAMTDPSTSPALVTALAYHQAWTSHDLDKAMTYIADNISCDAPGARISGAQPYRDFLGGFMAQLTGVQTVAAFGDDTTAVLFYYPQTANVADAPTAECFTVADGKITGSVLVFDRPSFAPPQR